jgi:hypothetical protein
MCQPDCGGVWRYWVTPCWGALGDTVLALPADAEGAPVSSRSGTWMTVRIARRAGKPVEIIRV